MAVTVTAQGRVHLGSHSVQPTEEGAEGGLRELQAWAQAKPDEAAALRTGDGPARVEVYVDRSASWDRVGSVLAFLAAPPNGVKEVWLAVAGPASSSDTRFVHGWLGRPDAARVVEEDIDPPARDSWRAKLLPLMPILPPAQYGRGPYDRYVREGIDWWIHVDGCGLTGDDVEVRGHTFHPSRPLDDPEVVAAANQYWASYEGDYYVFGSRQRGPAPMRVWWGGDWEQDEPAASRPAVVHVPAAYPVAYIDLHHATARGVRTGIIDREVLYLDLPPPARLLPSPPRSVWPPGVVLACLLTIVLSVVVARGRAQGSDSDETGDAIAIP